jgi:hypothetical protein
VSSVHVSPFMRADYSLAGFVISGRWPSSTHEWSQFLALAVRIAAYPGTLARTSVFRSIDDLPDDPQPDTVGLVTLAGPVIGEDAPRPGELATPQPAALFVLHPPSETTPSTPESAGAASGALLLPGVPHLGLEHRATWVEADADGTVTRLVSRVGVDPVEDPDIAVLATLLAA